MTTMNLNVAFECIEACINNGVSTMLHGPIGVGKTSGYKQLAKRLYGSDGFIYINPLIMDPTDLKGLPYYDQKTNTTVWLPPNWLPQIDRDGPKGIILIDEFSKASPALKNAAYELIFERRSGEARLLDGWTVHAAGNRAIDKSGDTRMPLALNNKMAHFEVGVDNDAWYDWMLANVDDPFTAVVVAFIRWRPELLHKMPANDQQFAFPTPRAWELVINVLKTASNTTRIHLVASLVGDAVAAEFEGFYRVWTNLPTIDEVRASPKTARVPQNEPAACYAIAAALGRTANKADFGKFLEYSARLPAEFDVLVGHDAVKRDPNLAKTKAYAEWATRTKGAVI